jgi:hypothetical protein
MTPSVGVEYMRKIGVAGSSCRSWRYGGRSVKSHIDSRFPGGVGNTQKDAARFTSLLDGVESKVFDRLPDATWVYPGHGSDTTLGAERPNLAEWRSRGW